MADKVIGNNSEVVMHFTIKLDDGSVADSTRDHGVPARFKMGDKSLTDSVEKELMGLKVGDKKELTLEPKDGFGEANPENIHSVPRENFPKDLELTLGDVIGFEQPDGVEVPGVIRDIQEKEVVVDFNHPLSGQTLKFELEIMDIDPEEGAAE